MLIAVHSKLNLVALSNGKGKVGLGRGAYLMSFGIYVALNNSAFNT